MAHYTLIATRMYVRQPDEQRMNRLLRKGYRYNAADSEVPGLLASRSLWFPKCHSASLQVPISDHERVGRASSSGLFLFENTFAD